MRWILEQRQCHSQSFPLGDLWKNVILMYVGADAVTFGAWSNLIWKWRNILFLLQCTHLVDLLSRGICYIYQWIHDIMEISSGNDNLEVSWCSQIKGYWIQMMHIIHFFIFTCWINQSHLWYDILCFDCPDLLPSADVAMDICNSISGTTMPN